MQYNTNRSRLTNRPVYSVPKSNNLKIDRDIREWLGTQNESEFAMSLCRFYDEKGGLTEKQLNAAIQMRIRTDNSYDPYGKNVIVGVYMDKERETIYKLSWGYEEGNLKDRSLRSRKSDMPNWKEVKDAGKRDFFNKVSNGIYVLMSEEELISIGKKTGICCVCGKVLDNEKSIAAGIGPYCLKKQREDKGA